MLFQLAENLGCTVAVLEESLTIEELNKWSQFYQQKAESRKPELKKDWSPADVKKQFGAVIG